MSNLEKKTRLEHLFRCCNSLCPNLVGLLLREDSTFTMASPFIVVHIAAACQAYIRPIVIVRYHPSPTQPREIANNDGTSVAPVAHSLVFSLPTIQ
jgi:hypothetical protein